MNVRRTGAKHSAQQPLCDFGRLRTFNNHTVSMFRCSPKILWVERPDQLRPTTTNWACRDMNIYAKNIPAGQATGLVYIRPHPATGRCACSLCRLVAPDMSLRYTITHVHTDAVFVLSAKFPYFSHPCKKYGEPGLPFVAFAHANASRVAYRQTLCAMFCFIPLRYREICFIGERGCRYSALKL